MKKIIKWIFILALGAWLILEAINFVEYLSVKGEWDRRTIENRRLMTGPVYRPLIYFFEAPTIAKPVIYLYPTSTEKVQVKLDYKGTLIADYPKYNVEQKGWTVTAYPDGKVIDSDGKEYSYLFWEGKPSAEIKYDFSTGFIVAGKDVREFLQDTLSKMGLTPKEYNEFIVYWYPQMKDNQYNLIHFAGSEYTNTAPLTITPKPDSMLRVFMVFKPLSQPVSIKPQEIIPFNRNGFTVVEWGGSKL